MIADFERRVIELEGELIQLRIQCHNDRFGANSKTIVKLRCMEGGEKAPSELSRWCDAIVGGNTVCNIVYGKVHAHLQVVPDSMCFVRSGFAIAVINETLTTIGGYGRDIQVTNKLCNLTGTGGGGEKTWIKQFLPCQLTLP